VVQDRLDELRQVGTTVTVSSPEVLDFVVNLQVQKESQEISDASVEEGIIASINSMVLRKVTPGETLYNDWLRQAISNTAGVKHYYITTIAVDGVSLGMNANVTPTSWNQIPWLDAVNISFI